MSPWRSRQFLLLSIVGVVAFAIPLRVALVRMSPTVDHAVRADVAYAMHEVLLAMKDYCDTHGALPPAVFRGPDGRDLYSWRLPLLPFVRDTDEIGAFDEDEPWTSDAHGVLRDIPEAPAFGYRGDRSAKLLLVVGADTAFDGKVVRRCTELPSDLIVLIEKADSQVFWMAPGDIELETIRQMKAKVASALFTSIAGAGFHVGFADGRVWFLSGDTPIEQLLRFMTMRGANHHDREGVLGCYRLR